MVIGGSSKPSYRSDLSAPEKMASKERVPKGRWSSESGGDNSNPLMMYQSVLRSDSQGSGSSPFGAACDGKAKGSDDSSASSTVTLTSSCCAMDDLNNISAPASHDDDEKMKDISAADQPFKSKSEVNLQNFIPLQHSPVLDQYEAPHIKIHPISPSENSSGTSVSSAASISTSSSVDSKLFYPDQEKSVSKNSMNDSPISTCTLSVANFTNTTGPITSHLISTAYSRLKDKDLLYKKRIRDLEKQVKKVPILEMKLKALKDENFLLLQQLKYFSETARSYDLSDSSTWSNQACGPSNIGTKQADHNIQNFGYCANSSGSENNLDKKDYSPDTKLTATAGFQTRNYQIKNKIGLENKENPMKLAATLFDLSCSSNSTKRNECNRFCIKCPNCCYRISNELLQTNIMKDQNVQTDPRLFTLERSTQTSVGAASKSQHSGSFVQNFDGTVSETGLNGSEPTANDQILNVMKYIAYLLSNDSGQDGNPSSEEHPSGHSPQTFHSKLRDFLNSESSCIKKVSERCATPLKVESAPIQFSNEIDPGVTKSVSSNAMFDSASHKIQEETDQLRKSPTRKPWMDNLSKIPSKHPRPRPSLNSVPTSLVVSPPDDYELASMMEQGQRLKFRSQQMPMADDVSKNDGVTQQARQRDGPKQIGDMSEAVHRHGVQRNLTLGVPVGSDDIKNIVLDTGGSAGSALFSVNLDQESKDRCHSGPAESVRSANAGLAPKSSVSSKKEDQKGSLKEESEVEVTAFDEELILSDELRAALQIVENYLRTPGKADTLCEKLAVKESYDLIKKHWFEEVCCASPSYVRKYLGILAQYSSILSQWIFGQQDTHGNTILHLLVANKNFVGLDEVLKLGFCDLNKFNKAGYTAAMIACTITQLDGPDMKVMKKLFQMSDLNLNSHKYGETALALACGHGVEDMVKLLLESGADINAQDNEGSTALMYAAEQNHMQIVKRLVDHPECDLHIEDRDGMAAWAVAMKAHNPNVSFLLFYHTFQKSVHTQKKRGASYGLPPFKKSRKHISHGCV